MSSGDWSWRCDVPGCDGYKVRYSGKDGVAYHTRYYRCDKCGKCSQWAVPVESIRRRRRKGAS